MRRKKSKKILPKLLYKVLPLWLVIVLILDSILLTGFLEYFIMKRQLNSNITKLANTTKNSDELIRVLTQEVLPQKGYTTSIVWGDIGKQLVDSGVIDRKKFEESLSRDIGGTSDMKYLEGESGDKIMINEKNSHFLLNALWALGLVNKSKILDEGPMQTVGNGPGNFASTGGWTLGQGPAMQYYSTREIIKLTPEQQDLVKKIADNVYRPCCGNATSFPDCNHGMAALGYIELAVSKGVSEKQIYKDLLALNSFWFPTNYVEMATFFNKDGTDWKNIDPKIALSRDYSSAQGAQRIRQTVQNVPGIQGQGGGCGV